MPARCSSAFLSFLFILFVLSLKSVCSDEDELFSCSILDENFSFRVSLLVLRCLLSSVHWINFNYGIKRRTKKIQRLVRWLMFAMKRKWSLATLQIIGRTSFAEDHFVREAIGMTDWLAGGERWEKLFRFERLSCLIWSSDRFSCMLIREDSADESHHWSLFNVLCDVIHLKRLFDFVQFLWWSERQISSLSGDDVNVSDMFPRRCRSVGHIFQTDSFSAEMIHVQSVITSEPFPLSPSFEVKCSDYAYIYQRCRLDRAEMRWIFYIGAMCNSYVIH